MERKSVLLGVAVVLAGYSAFAHLGVGLAEVLGSVPDGTLPVLPVLFILSAVVVGLFLVSLARGVALPTIYLVGGVLMILHLLAYVDVHALGYLETATGVDMHGHDGGHSHDGGHAHDGSQSQESGHTHDDSSGHEHNGDSNDHGADGHTHEDGEAGHTHNDGTENHSHDGGSSDHTHADGADGHSHADGGGEHAHNGDESAGQVLITHLRDDLTALSTKIAETGSAIAFFALYVLER